MRLKNKTELRKIILRNCYGTPTTELYDRVWFFEDGSWTVTSQNTTITNCYGGVTIGGLIDIIYDVYNNNNNITKINKKITSLFHAIEEGMEDYYIKNDFHHIEYYYL